MHNNQYPRVAFDVKTAFRLSIVISVIIFFIMLITFFFAKSRDINKGVSFFDLLTVNSLVTFITNFLLLLTLFSFQFWVIRRYKNPKKRILFLIFGSLLLLFIISPLLTQIQWWMFIEILPLNFYLIAHFIKDIIIVVITLLFTALLHAASQAQEALWESQKISLENLQNRYDALKNQVDPHFLFNSLNTLNGLIGYDDEKAHEYVDQLASVFRYTMQNKEVIQLQEELDFAESYIYLMKIRYNDSLQIETKVGDKYLVYYILPFGLEILIENAIKHNIVSKKYPLYITIDTTEKGTIRVKNNIQLKPDTVSSGIGLANLNERYQLSFNKEIEINQDENHFIVEIPLIKDIKKYDDKFDIKSNRNENCYC